jgi:hypothetical protein
MLLARMEDKIPEIQPEEDFEVLEMKSEEDFEA